VLTKMPRKTSSKIHFIHQFEKSFVLANLGDWLSSPYYYFSEFFSQYICVLHSVWSVHWHEIERSDVVIFGGGGLIDNSDSLNKVINKIIDRCDNVIIWGAGSHKYSNNSFGVETAKVKIQFEKLSLCGIRDYQHPYTQEPYKAEYVPCVSCMHTEFDIAAKKDLPIINSIGTISHGLDDSFPIRNIPSAVTNSEPISTITNYILSSRVMLATSYHGSYWSMLLGRKVILHSSRLIIEKYNYFRHRVGIFEGNQYDETEILKIADSIPEITDFLTESKNITLKFFEKVKKHIEQVLTKNNLSNIGTVQILGKRTAQLEFSIHELSNMVEKLQKRLGEIENKAN
jgi:hypothetical protein